MSVSYMDFPVDSEAVIKFQVLRNGATTHWPEGEGRALSAAIDACLEIELAIGKDWHYADETLPANDRPILVADSESRVYTASYASHTGFWFSWPLMVEIPEEMAERIICWSERLEMPSKALQHMEDYLDSLSSEEIQEGIDEG